MVRELRAVLPPRFAQVVADARHSPGAGRLGAGAAGTGVRGLGTQPAAAASASESKARTGAAGAQRHNRSIPEQSAAAAFVLDFDGLIEPGARSEHLNFVVFAERTTDLRVTGSEPVDWTRWRSQRQGPAS